MLQLALQHSGEAVGKQGEQPRWKSKETGLNVVPKGVALQME